jgi:ComF family protein
MLQRIQTAVEFLYPPRCLGCGMMVDTDFGLCGPCWRDTPFIGGLVCEACGTPLQGGHDGHRIECDDCMKTPRPWHSGRSALVYKDRARQMVLALKHGDRAEIARPAALWMGRVARELVQDNMLIVPVPLHWTRLIKRRYNQSALLTQALGQELGLPHCLDALVRPRRTRMLDGISVEERFARLAGAIAVNSKRRHRITARPVLLVDDVMTSGATLGACAEALRAAGSREVYTVTLARVAKDA